MTRARRNNHNPSNLPTCRELPRRNDDGPVILITSTGLFAPFNRLRASLRAAVLAVCVIRGRFSENEEYHALARIH